MFEDRKVLPMVAEAKEYLELAQRLQNAEQIEDAKKCLALWKKESRDRTGIDVWEPSLAGMLR
jgi:hypothetical protein